MSRSSVPAAARGGGRRAGCFHLTWVTCAATRAAATLCEDVAPDQAQRHDDGEERHRFRYCFHRCFLIPGSITLIHDAVWTPMWSTARRLLPWLPLVAMALVVGVVAVARGHRPRSPRARQISADRSRLDHDDRSVASAASGGIAAGDHADDGERRRNRGN